MGFTDFCSVYAAIHEAGINQIISHMMTQRPLLFNYATDHFRARPSDFCSAINHIREVTDRGNPLFTKQLPLPIIGANGVAGLDYCFQVTQLQVDFYPSNVFSLPAELNPPLASQQLGLKLRVCGAIVCPDRATAEFYGEVVSDRFGKVVHLSEAAAREVSAGVNLKNSGLNFDIAGQATNAAVSTRDAGLTADAAAQARDSVATARGTAILGDIGETVSTRDTIALGGSPQCFCLDVYATAHMEIVNVSGVNRLGIKLDGLEIVDITPTGLENSLECYMISVLRVGILPRIRIALDTVMFNVGGFLALSVTPTAISGSVPHNPAVEDNLVKVFINVGV